MCYLMGTTHLGNHLFTIYVLSHGYGYGHMAAGLLFCDYNRRNAGLAIEKTRVRIPFAIVSKFGHFRSLHDASVDSAV